MKNLIIYPLFVITFALIGILLFGPEPTEIGTSAVFTDVHDLNQGGIQVFQHNLGHKPTHMVFTAYTEGTVGQSQFVYDLDAIGEKKGVGMIRLDDKTVMNGAYIFVFDQGSHVMQGIDQFGLDKTFTIEKWLCSTN